MRPLHGVALMAAAAGVLGGVGACSDSTRPGGPILPDSAIPYLFLPSLISYDYVDSSGGTTLRLHWLSDMPFAGYNCLGFVPGAAPGDTAGQFYFATSGPNLGNLESQTGGETDTILGYFLPIGIGSEGTFTIQDGNRLHLTWADGGTPSRYFDPAADLRFVGDTLWSHLDRSFNADSGHVVWRVAWIQRACE